MCTSLLSLSFLVHQYNGNLVNFTLPALVTVKGYLWLEVLFVPLLCVFASVLLAGGWKERERVGSGVNE